MCYVTVVYMSISFVNLEEGMWTLVLSSFMGFPGISDGKETTCNARDLCSIPGLGRSPGGGHGNPVQSVFLSGESLWTGEPGGLQSVGSQSRT